MLPISKQIKERMTQKGVSAHALEKLAGLKNSAVHNILYGRSKNPSINTLLAISRALECDVSDLLSDSCQPHLFLKENLDGDGQPLVWNAELYMDTLKIVHSLSLRHNISLSKAQWFACTEEVYAYSLKHNRAKPDKNFAEWILEKSL